MVGSYFTKIRISRINAAKYVTQRLSISMKRRRQKSESHPKEEIRINGKKAQEFLEKKLREHIIHWEGPKI